MIARNDLKKNKSLSSNLDIVFLQDLIWKWNIVVDRLAKRSIKIEYEDWYYLLAKKEKKIRLSCLKEDSSTSSTTINDILYFSKYKIHLLFLG